MNPQAPSRPLLRRLGVCALLLPAACSNPFAPQAWEKGERVPIERLRGIDHFKLDQYARPAPGPVDPSAPNALQQPVSRFAGMESLDVPLDRVRAATLENNLDLKVALIDPLIAGETLRAEEAKFEAVFVPGVRYREDDAPTLDITSPNQQDSLGFSAGVDIPLRTGGRVSVDMSEDRRETANPFITLNTSYSALTSFSISHPLLRNAGHEVNSHSIRIAAYQEQIVESRTKLEVIRQLAAADRAYWRLYAAQRELSVRQQQFELATAQLQQAERRVRAGDVAEIEVIRAQAGVAERLESIIIVENAILDRQRNIKRIVNIPGLEMETTVKLNATTEPTPAPYSFDPVKLADLAVANRMEMLELELQLAQDLSTVNFAKNQALPLFTLDYVYNIQGLGESLADANGVLWRNHFETWQVGLSGQIPIGNEAAKARVQEAILGRLQRLSTKESRRLAIRQEVLTAIDSVEAAWQRILAARQSAIAAARAFEGEKRQNEVGLRTSTDVLDAAARLADAQSAEIRALTDYQISLVDLSFATGTVLGAAKIDWSPLDPRTQIDPIDLEPTAPAPNPVQPVPAPEPEAPPEPAASSPSSPSSAPAPY